MGAEATLALLQVCDSAFPAGTFAHSYGLEQLRRDRRVTSPADVEAYVRSLVREQASGADARTTARAYAAAATYDLDALIKADAALFATKAAEELRTASTVTGQRMLLELAAHEEAQAGLVTAFLAAAQAGHTPGTAAAALGVAGHALGADREDTVAASLFTLANTVLSASMRLLPVSHRDVQGALHRLRPVIAGLAAEACAAAEAGSPLTSFHPLQEIASMRHRRAGARLFAS